MISTLVFVKKFIHKCFDFGESKELAVTKEEGKYDLSFFDVDPFKDHLQVETTENELCRLLYTLRKPGAPTIRIQLDQVEPLGHCCPQMDAMLEFLNDLVEFHDDSGIETASDGSFSPKPLSRAPSPYTTWY